MTKGKGKTKYRKQELIKETPPDVLEAKVNFPGREGPLNPSVVDGYRAITRFLILKLEYQRKKKVYSKIFHSKGKQICNEKKDSRTVGQVQAQRMTLARKPVSHVRVPGFSPWFWFLISASY